MQKFARRGLAKISELSQLEMMSSHTDCAASELAFRTATVKVRLDDFLGLIRMFSDSGS